MPQFGASLSATSYSPDLLIAGDFPRVTDTVTIASGQNLVRGSVLGQITASGKYVLALSASADGSQTPVAILADDVNATAGDTLGGIFLTGEFDANAVTLGAGITAAAAKAALRAVSIFLKLTTWTAPAS